VEVKTTMQFSLTDSGNNQPPKRESVALGDTDVRPALRSRLLQEYRREPDTVFIEELGLCRGEVRIDLAVVNGQLHGFEIKSDRDSLRRLGGQVEIYRKVFDRVTLVAGERHLKKVLGFLPLWWAVRQIIQGADGIRFKSVRRGRRNPCRDPRALVELLWLDDAVALLAQRDAARGIRGKPRRVVWDKVCELYSLEEIAVSVRERLKARAAPQDPARLL
jgi:hypothetical protein